jgi:predicted transcriptional regulator of viral defense system
MVYFSMARSRILSVDEVKALTGNYQTARTVLHHLARKGFALRAHWGTYFAIPPDRIGMSFEVDRYSLGQRAAGKSGILSYHSALELHGVAQSYMNMVLISVRMPRRGFTFQGFDYHFIASGFTFGTMSVVRDGLQLSVTDKERTFLDCLRRLDLAGGLEEAYKSITTFHNLDMDRTLAYLRRFKERSLFHRAGYILSTATEQMGIDSPALDKFRRNLSLRAYYLVPGQRPGHGRFVKEWRLVVPDNIEEVLRFA